MYTVTPIAASAHHLADTFSSQAVNSAAGLRIVIVVIATVVLVAIVRQLIQLLRVAVKAIMTLGLLVIIIGTTITMMIGLPTSGTMT